MLSIMPASQSERRSGEIDPAAANGEEFSSPRDCVDRMHDIVSLASDLRDDFS
jgi:hypothetical protein